MTFQALKDYSIYIPYSMVQYFIKFYISLNESLSPDAYSCKCVFKDKRLHDHVFLHSDTFYGQRLLSLKNNGKVHLHLIVQYEKNTDFFGSNTGKYWTVTW